MSVRVLERGGGSHPSAKYVCKCMYLGNAYNYPYITQKKSRLKEVAKLF